MKERKKPRTIQIPLWMDAAVSELALLHKRSISAEIEFLVEAAMREYGERTKVSESAQVLVEK
ncbi:hypothetical protein [Treponema primitia]|uniref:hypothetical protein n=1 Tax=Treponema primitia TaxID=88058 RepID=UPI0002FD6E20|nr:hypothetical protein [Treponema primitia]